MKRKIPSVNWFVCKPCREYFKSRKSYDKHKLTIHGTEPAETSIACSTVTSSSQQISEIVQNGNATLTSKLDGLTSTTRDHSEEDSNTDSAFESMKDYEASSHIKNPKDRKSRIASKMNSIPYKSSRLRVKAAIKTLDNGNSRNDYAKHYRTYARASRGHFLINSITERIKVPTEVLSILKPCSVDLSMKTKLTGEWKKEISDSKLLKCKICTKYFVTNSDLLLHERLHCEQLSFECYMCSKKFRLRFQLNCHLQTHLASTPFSCNVPPDGILHRQRPTLTENRSNQKGCNSSEEISSDLWSDESPDRSLVSPDPSRPYSCHVCGKAFSSNFGVKRHMLSHTGVRAFRCEKCGKSYKHKEHLKSHTLTHADSDAFSCNLCPMSFKRKSLLIAHQRTHIGKNHFPCKLCGKTFTRVAILMRHRRRIHG